MPAFRPLLLTLVLIAALASGTTTSNTTAALQTGATAGTNRFSSGTLVIDANVASGSSLALSNLVPGDSRTLGLTVANAGTLSLRYAMSTSVTGHTALGNALLLT